LNEPRRQKGKPTIDQRLEAVVQTLEIVARMQLTTETELSRLTKLSIKVMTSHEDRIKKLERRK
jgi:hypothetical protein